MTQVEIDKENDFRLLTFSLLWVVLSRDRIDNAIIYLRGTERDSTNAIIGAPVESIFS